MSVSPARARTRRLALALAGALAGAALAAAPASATQAEQISRADGVNGASPIENYAAGPSTISEDGTNAYFVFEQSWGSWTTANGLWRRNLVTNRTSQIVGGPASIAGLSADGKVLGFRTAKRLSPADTNNVTDLYAYDSTTAAITLVSRWDGPSAAAVGLTGPGFITRDGKTALYSTNIGVARRDLATGKTVKAADGALADYTADSASVDGTVLWTGTDKLVTPRGVENLAVADTYAPLVRVTPNGRYAIVQATRASDGRAVGFVLDTTTGVRTAYDPDGLGVGARLVTFTADGRPLVLRSTATGFELLALTLPTGAVARVSTFGVASYAVSTVTSNGRFVSTYTNGSSVALSADGVNLPGGAGTELPSPGVYLNVLEGCRASGWPFYNPAQASSIGFTDIGGTYPLPPVATVALRITSASGALISSYTLPADTPKLPVGGGFKVSATATFKDGRTASESWTVPAPTGTCSIGF